MSEYIKPFESCEFVKLTEEELIECKSIIVKIKELRFEATKLLNRLNIIRYGTEYPILIQKGRPDSEIDELEKAPKKKGGKA